MEWGIKARERRSEPGGSQGFAVTSEGGNWKKEQRSKRKYNNSHLVKCGTCIPRASGQDPSCHKCLCIHIIDVCIKIKLKAYLVNSDLVLGWMK